ncbi:MAG: thiamine phosphate synthase [Bacteroidaceae bacterium]|nr:thiamine phosphate synthase [Bacteroidaceae bacterium]
MKTVVITLPDFFDGEAERIVRFLHQGNVDIIHLRKPSSTLEELEALIRQIPESYYGCLVLHDHHSLAEKYNLFGVHLNGRNPQPPKGWKGSVSRSCHSLKEVEVWKSRCNYVSLSPIFDSISKKGYMSSFTQEQLDEARIRGIIDDKVYALGGVTFEKFKVLEQLGFGGAMILGDAWK